jgi:thioester reductase-like protein
MPDYINLNQEFRNPYELSKLEAEIQSRNFAKDTGIKFRCFRPSTIGGRLIEAPLGMIHKFDVFYGYAASWFYIKMGLIPHYDERYSFPVSLDAAVCYNVNSGLNIVPADYAAKVMYEVCMHNHSDESFHLVNNTETPHDVCINAIFETFNIQGVRVVDKIPSKLNRVESFYYKTAGKIFTPYLVSEPMLFNTVNLSDMLMKANLCCPRVDKDRFMILIDYAKEYDFGIKIHKSK